MLRTVSEAARGPLASPAGPRLASLGRLFEPGGEISRAWYVTLAILSFALPLAAWFLLAQGGALSAYLLPAPARVIDAGVGLFTRGALLPDIGISFYRVMMGFFISALIAIPVGLLAGTFKPVEALLEPLVGFIRYLPAAAFIPLVIVWLGIGENAKIGIIFIGTFFQMVLIVADITRRVPAQLRDVSRTLGASNLQIIRHVLAPAVAPGLLDTMRVMAGWAWTYLVVAELVAANSGLGFRILKAQRFLATADVFAGIVVIGLLGLATDLVFKLVTARLVPWSRP
jgi:NitT/TauT family transport system permease protein